MPSPASSYPRIAFVDLETTGATANRDRITEVGIVELTENGFTEWSSLVNPETSIPEFIQSLTGISNQMVASAPTFAELADEIHARLEGRLFVAHNARFDHGFLKNEFKRTGHTFSPTVLCTVKLSRKLYPGYARHNLDSLIERHRLHVTDRHRALGDAQLLHQFWNKITHTLPSESIDDAIKQLCARPALPSQVDPAVVDELPSGAGVYLFYGDSTLPLYIGKAINIRKRVLSHFASDHQLPKELEMSQEMRRIEWIETAGELGALLLEAALVKRMAPRYNSLLRQNEEVCSWRAILPAAPNPQSEQLAAALAQAAAATEIKAKPKKAPDNRLQLALSSTDDLFFGQDEHLYGLFSDKRKATSALTSIADQHQLCPGILGLDKKWRRGSPCFAHQVKRCLGACCGKESIEDHNARTLEALEKIKLQGWPFDSAIGLPEGKALHVINNWHYAGTVTDWNDAPALARNSLATFDKDVYQLMQKWLPKLEDRIVRL